ncbi:hypothetical protein Trydic_g10895 [Trypoxylus dichotomus]
MEDELLAFKGKKTFGCQHEMNIVLEDNTMIVMTNAWVQFSKTIEGLRETTSCKRTAIQDLIANPKVYRLQTAIIPDSGVIKTIEYTRSVRDLHPPVHEIETVAASVRVQSRLLDINPGYPGATGEKERRRDGERVGRMAFRRGRTNDNGYRDCSGNLIYDTENKSWGPGTVRETETPAADKLNQVSCHVEFRQTTLCRR